MGVHGLWQLLEPTATPVTVESLGGKRLAIDISIWLHSALHSYGCEERNGHIAVLFSRILKLLFYDVRPVFAFDGPNVPFKHRELASRRLRRDAKKLSAEENKRKLLTAYAASTQHDFDLGVSPQKIQSLLDRDQAIDNDPYKQSSTLPESVLSSSSDDEYFEDVVDEQNVEASVSFDSSDCSPMKPSYSLRDTLLEKKERMKQSRVKLSDLPDNSDHFSKNQFLRLMERAKLNRKLDQMNESLARQHAVQHGLLEAGKTNAKIFTSLTNGQRKRSKRYNIFVIKQSNDQNHIKMSTGDCLTNIKRSNSPPRTHLTVANVAFKASWLATQPKNELPEENLETDHDLINQPSTSQFESQATTSFDRFSDSDSELSDNENSHDMLTLIPNDEITIESSTNKAKENKEAIIELEKLLDKRQELENKVNQVLNEDVEARTAMRVNFIDKVPSNVLQHAPEFVEPSISYEPCESKSPLTNQIQVTEQTMSSKPVEQTQQIDIEPVTICAIKDKYMKDQANQNVIDNAVYDDCQILLRLMCIPYVLSPAEAEAQCAYLQHADLVDAVVSDDSDSFLFGATTVYRHVFNKDQHIQKYDTRLVSTGVQSFLLKNRSALIALAMLSGCDYTTGIYGIGSVSAIEILAEFLPEDEDDDRYFIALERFALWYRTEVQGKHVDRLPIYDSAVKRKLAKLLLTTSRPIPEAFPDRAIFDAFMKPVIDESLERFQWINEFDVEPLCEYLFEKLGWPHSRTMQLIKPVFDAIQKRNARQTRIDQFTIRQIKENLGFEHSKRARDALLKLYIKQKQLSSSQPTSSTPLVKKGAIKKRKVERKRLALPETMGQAATRRSKRVALMKVQATFQNS